MSPKWIYLARVFLRNENGKLILNFNRISKRILKFSFKSFYSSSLEKLN